MATIQNEARTSYVGVGRRQIVEQTFWQVPWWNRVDPLAQTFLLTEERFITAVDLFFFNKDTKPVTIQIRDVVNGYPGTTVLTSRVLNPADVNVSEKGTIPTKVTFPEPVLLQANVEYAIVVLTGSSQYRLFVARMTGKDTISGNIVARQPYAVGVLFSSSNATAWTAHQDMDMKFTLYGARFSPEGSLYFNSLTVDQATHLLLSTSQLVPQGSTLQWQWSPNETDWFALADSDVTALSKEYSTIHVRALLKGQGHSSPVIQPNSTAVAAMSYKNTGTYISRQITSPTSFTKVTVYVDFYTPTGTNQVVEYTTNDGGTWKGFGTPASTQVIDDLFTQHKFEATTSTSTALRIRITQSTTVATTTPQARRLMVTLS